jgi:Fe-S-cluster-containing hydrogenase component 2
MAKRILIDMIRLRTAMVDNPSLTLPEALYYPAVVRNGLKTIRELAVFRFTCRRCEDAPCIAVCPAEALEKDSDGIISRLTNLCVACKSCVIICPFGTMMGDFFDHHRDREILYDLTSERELEKFIKSCPEGTVSMVESDESPADNIYRFNENILVREYLYSTEKE